MNCGSPPTERESDSGLLHWLERAFVPLAGRLFGGESRLHRRLERALRQAGDPNSADRQLAVALGTGITVGFAVLLVGAGVSYTIVLSGALEGSVPTVFVGASLLGTLGFAIGFGSILLVPFRRAAARRREIDALLPDAVAYMYALSVGGLDRVEIVDSMADAEDAYGEVAVSFQRVRRETTFFDTDFRTAVRKQARETPSEELERFLLDLLSTVSNGGSVTSFLERAKQSQFRTASQRQERRLQTLELVAELYLTLSLFPLLVTIVLVVLQLLPESSIPDGLLYLAVYGLVPLIGIGFLVAVSVVTRDDYGGGRLRNEDRSAWEGVPDRVRRRERIYSVWNACRHPHTFFVANPIATLGISIPLAVGILTAVVTTGIGPGSWSELVDRPLYGTAVYVYLPLYVVSIPLAFYYECHARRQAKILETLSDDFEALSSASESGLTLLESLESVSRSADGGLRAAFGTVRTKVAYGGRLSTALVELSNRYREPRLTRTIRLLADAQAVSNRMSAVLSTAARAAQQRERLEAERRSRTRTQVAIVCLSFLTVLAVMILLQTQFVGSVPNVETGAGDTPYGNGGNQMASVGTIDERTITTILFHAVTLQALLAGCVCGYVRDGTPLSGLKYVIALTAIALACWTVVL